MIRYTVAAFVVLQCTSTTTTATTTAIAVPETETETETKTKTEYYEQHGCTSYYNTGYAHRPFNSPYMYTPDLSISVDDCAAACRVKNYDYFGFECPMPHDVHCQCYSAQTIQDKPVEEAVCKDKVGKDGDKHCTGPAMMNGLSLGGADIGSIYKVQKVEVEVEVTSVSGWPCPVETGYCVKADTTDQNEGVIKINSIDGNTKEAQQECLRACLKHKGATGCEVIWDQGNRGCYIMTDVIDHGNQVDRHLCWLFNEKYDYSTCLLTDEIDTPPPPPTPTSSIDSTTATTTTTTTKKKKCTSNKDCDENGTRCYEVIKDYYFQKDGTELCNEYEGGCYCKKEQPSSSNNNNNNNNNDEIEIGATQDSLMDHTAIATATTTGGDGGSAAACPACCSGLEQEQHSVEWVTTQDDPLSNVTAFGSEVLMEFADDELCGGKASLTQNMTATATVILPEATTFDLLWSAVAEDQYETLTITVNGEIKTKFTAEEDGTCLVSTCVMCVIKEQTQQIQLNAGTNIITVDTTTEDGWYHQGAFFRVRFRQASCDADCSVCELTSDLITVSDKDEETMLIDPLFPATSEGATTTSPVVEAKDNCTEIPLEIMLKETLGNPSDEFSYVKDAVQIINNNDSQSSSIDDTVTFTVSQVWLKQGTPMIAVQYPGGINKEEVCNMEASRNDGAPLIEYGTTANYTAQCTHGYADISVYLYVGNVVDFDVEECESCSAPSNDYVGYYLTLPCASMCEIVQDATTVAPSITPIISNDDPVSCPEDVTLIRKVGSTEFPVDNAVKIISQDTKTVTVELKQAWTTSSSIDQIYTSFKDSPYDRHCFETNNVDEGLYDTVTITCNFFSPKAYLEICVVDDLTHAVLSMNDDQATIPKCCQAKVKPETPIVCYSLEINCVTECMEETQQRQRQLKVPFSSSSSLSSSSSSLRATARKLK